MTSSLFEPTISSNKIPLAERLRPSTLTDIVGQTHLLGEGKPLRLAFESKQAHSMILWGPPGVGKTTLARLAAHLFGCEMIALSAVLAGVKDIRAAMDQAAHNQQQSLQTLLFIDEIHRFNKSQQDALLPYIESGHVIFIGATTENPSFEVNSALLSRAQVYVLKALNESELGELIQKAITHISPNIRLSGNAKTLLIATADGDARRALNVLEQVLLAAQTRQQNDISLEWLQTVLPQTLRRFDKQGEQFYDQISALHKSVRGSNPDAALYWFCRMIDGGVDIAYLSRRIVRMAWEDIGLADPRAIQLANDAANTYERLGSPEGELALAQAVIYLAVAAKSNAGYRAFNEALAFVKQDTSRAVPLHLRNAPTQLMKDLNYKQNYRYAHDEPHAYAAGESYLPDDFPKEHGHWYHPVSRGLEQKIAEKLAFLRELDQQKLNEVKQ